MSTLLDYPAQLLTTRQVLSLLGYRHARTLRRLIREESFPKASISPGRRGQRFRASLVNDWLRRSEQGGLSARRKIFRDTNERSE
jgi:predicted DNA-binding transcriptional regulator AlpA